MDESVSRAFRNALSQLSRAGAKIVDVPLRELGELQDINARGGFPAYESFQWHKELISRNEGLYDRRVISRILRGCEIDALEYTGLARKRAEWIRRFTAAVQSYDAIIFPTTPTIAPLLADLSSDAEYNRMNLLMLRNSSAINFANGCAASVPCHEKGDAPVGISIASVAGNDKNVFAIARAIESVFR